MEAQQLDLFEKVLTVFGKSGGRDVSNDELYEKVGDLANIAPDEWRRTEAIGADGAPHSPLRRKVRWYQQTLKQLGLLERGESRGLWRLTAAGKRKLSPAAPRRVMLGFSTDLGIALWANSEDVFKDLQAQISLSISSPPYPLAVPRAYGNPTADVYVDWLIAQLEPVVKRLMPGGSVVLNVSQDIFMSGSPARSLYRARLEVALHDRLGLHPMETLIWHNPSKSPGPIRWASLEPRVHLNVAYEPILWFTNDPARVRSCNRRVLQPHSPRHQKLIDAGGEQRITSYGDGANRLRKGSFGAPTAGKIPRNVITAGHRCADQTVVRNFAKANGIPTHGAAMPLSVAKFLVEFLTEPGDLVVDQFAGWFTSCKAAQITGRHWAGTERMGEYVVAGAQRFLDCDGFELLGDIA